MRITEAFDWFARGQRIAWGSLRAGTLHKAGWRSAVGAFVRPITAPSRYPEYAVCWELLDEVIDQGETLLDIGSPKLFSLLLASRTRTSVVATDIWPPAIEEAAALCGGLSSDARARVQLAVADARESLVHLAPHGGFAGAFSMSVVEHIEPDPGGDVLALEQIAEVVRPGGVIVVSVPVDVEARSEHRDEMYGRERGAFFQRVYDAQALRALCEATPLDFDCCVLTEWPDHPILTLQPKFPTALGFAGASFPLLANRFTVSERHAEIPAIRRQGDAILRFRKAGAR